MLTIDGTSYDEYLVTKSYAVSQANEYGGTEYQDGWWRKHRTVVRTRVAGTAVLAMNPSAYTALVNALKENAGTEGEHTVRLYVNNLNKEVNITAFIACDAKVAISTHNFGDRPVFFNATLTIEER